MLKLGGEMFGGGRVGIDPDVVQNVARQIAEVSKSGAEVAVVIGGGNFFRGAELQQRGMDRARSDYMGMLGTVMNCLALQDFLQQEGVDCRVQTSVNMAQIAEPYLPLRADRHLEKGRVVIFGAGMGMPYFSTDTTAAQAQRLPLLLQNLTIWQQAAPANKVKNTLVVAKRGGRGCSSAS